MKDATIGFVMLLLATCLTIVWITACTLGVAILSGLLVLAGALDHVDWVVCWAVGCITAVGFILYSSRRWV